MILRELSLTPFAGLARFQVAFQEGFNVVLGPNEAGKSTLVHGLKMALFVQTKYDKKVFDREIRPFLPLAGGDTIEVELTFSARGQTFRLKKSWGSRKDSSLHLPQGGVVADPSAVHQEVQRLLGLSEGTYQNVLIGFQASLSQTFENLKEDPTATHDLTSILRRGFLETDGVSIEKLGQAIEARFRAYFDRWDPLRKGPEGSRGIDNPYVREVGKILGAYYEKERLLRSLREAVEFERRMDDLNREILALSQEIASLRGFIDGHRSIVEDARRRQVLEVQKASLQEKEKRLREISQKWPALDQEVTGKKEVLGELRERQKKLEQEYQQASAYELNLRRLEKFNRAEKKRQEMEEAGKKLADLKIVKEGDYQRLERLHQELDRLKTSLKAGRIVLTFTSEQAMDLRVAKDLDAESPHSLGPGQSLEVSAGGQIRISHENWHLKVRSGETDFEKLTAAFTKRFGDYQTLLTTLGVSDLSEGKRACEEYRRQLAAVENLTKQFNEILEGEPYEELQAFSKSTGQARPLRTTQEIHGEIVEVKGRMSRAESDMESKVRQLTEWERAYKSSEALLDLLIEKRSELKGLEKSLQDLRPLPEAVKEPGKWIREFEEKQETLKQRESAFSELRIQKASLEGKAAEETREELEAQSKEAERRFQQVLTEGEALLEIRKAFEQIRSDMDSQTLNPWLDELRRVVMPLTAHRYHLVSMGQGELDKVIRKDGLEMPTEVLSQGTRVGLGLALRLSMARYFLKDSDGFLILDDPLVDLDEERQQAASQVIRNFSGEKQVILLTCHPRHADLLGGHIIRLNPDTR